MEFEQFDNFSDDNINDSIDFREVIEKYLSQWKWYVLSALIFSTLAYFFLRNEAPMFESKAKILIKEVGKGSSVADLSSFEDLGLVSSSDNSLENEIHILTSRRLMTKVVRELNLNIKYYIENSPYDKEIFPNSPIILEIQNESETISNIENDSISLDNKEFENDRINNIYRYFKILVLSNERYTFFNDENVSLGTRSFNEFIETDFGKLKITLNESFNFDVAGKSVIVIISPVIPVADTYMNRVIVEPVEGSRIIIISIREHVIAKGIAIVNNLIDQYNADAVEDKNKIHLNTIKFLNERIDLLTSELTAIERTAEIFKTKNRMVNEFGGGDTFLITSSENESDLISANMQLSLVEYMLDDLKKKEIDETLPVNIGLSDISINHITLEYNDLVMRRNRILKSSSTKNPSIIGIDAQLQGLRNNLEISLENLKSSAEIRVNSLTDQSDRLNYRIASVPKNEREFNDIVRQQETKNVLYLFLLQKREESILSKSVNIDKAILVDSAYSNRRPVSPKKKVTYLASILIGLLIPTVIIYLKDILDTKVHDENDLKKLKIPIVGDVPQTKIKKTNFIKDGDASHLAEAFRYIRTNLGFMLDRVESGKVIFVTSTVKSEGKTFTAINLASSLAISGKRTLILGMDLRAPKISKYLKVEDKLGVTNFIVDDTLIFNDMIEEHPNFSKLDIINSGNIPPNPVELLMSKRVDEIFETARKTYDYIIVDTAPVGMVTDTIQISKYADLTIYVVKANFLDKRMLQIPDKLNRESKLTNMTFLINGSDHSKGAYGQYGYGYGYGNKRKKPWYKGG